MGSFCNYCGRIRPNEKFSGKNRKIGLCAECAKKPKEILKEIKDSIFIENVLFNQSNISKGNIESLKNIMNSSIKLCEKAKLVSEIGKIYPNKKKRIGKLFHNRKDLYDKLVEFNFIEDHNGILENEIE